VTLTLSCDPLRWVGVSRRAAERAADADGDARGFPLKVPVDSAVYQSELREDR
jgi:hypothetical protein